jgi:hypothetical protein
VHAQTGLFWFWRKAMGKLATPAKTARVERAESFKVQV